MGRQAPRQIAINPATNNLEPIAPVTQSGA
jgi:hypothetical protein